MKRLELGIVSDEISLDFEEAFRYARAWGIRLFEIRNLLSGRVPFVEESEIRSIESILKNEDVQVTAISPGLFKAPISQREVLEANLRDHLPRALELASRMEVKKIILFGFLREAGEQASNYFTCNEYLRSASEMAKEYGCEILIENEHGFWCDSGSHTAKMLIEIDAPNLKVNWDPCNAYLCDEALSTGYERVKYLLGNMHVKDTRAGSHVECVPIGEGAIDWKGQLRALIQDEIIGHVTIETHCHPLVEQSKKNVETIRRLQDEIESEFMIGRN